MLWLFCDYMFCHVSGCLQWKWRWNELDFYGSERSVGKWRRRELLASLRRPLGFSYPWCHFPLHLSGAGKFIHLVFGAVAERTHGHLLSAKSWQETAWEDRDSERRSSQVPTQKVLTSHSFCSDGFASNTANYSFDFIQQESGCQL